MPGIQSGIKQLDEELRSSREHQPDHVLIPVLSVLNSSDHFRKITGAVLKELTFDLPRTVRNLDTTTTMLIVRNPWVRLLSAYRDKLETSITPDQRAFQVKLPTRQTEALKRDFSRLHTVVQLWRNTGRRGWRGLDKISI